MGEILQSEELLKVAEARANKRLHTRSFDETHRKALLFRMFLHVNTDLDDFQRSVLTKVIGPEATRKTLEDAVVQISNKILTLSKSGWKPEKAGGDMVNRPHHYDRLPMEPTYFIVESGGFHWCIENFIKYICRFRWKNGIEDLGKALRNLGMYVKWVDGDQEWSR